MPVSSSAERPAILLRRFAFQNTPNGRRHKKGESPVAAELPRFGEAKALTVAVR
jgi:hypothetical protein